MRIGMTVSAAPAPYPAAVSPTASPPPVGEPFDRVADADGVDRPAADTRDRRARVKRRKRFGIGIDDPADRHEDAADGDDEPRTPVGPEPVRDPAMDGGKPCLERDEDAEGNLYPGNSPTVFLRHRIDEERPSILQVGDQHHADNADDELRPPIGGRSRRCANCRRICHSLLQCRSARRWALILWCHFRSLVERPPGRCKRVVAGPAPESERRTGKPDDLQAQARSVQQDLGYACLPSPISDFPNDRFIVICSAHLARGKMDKPHRMKFPISPQCRSRI